jgi:hypothetical protein
MSPAMNQSHPLPAALTALAFALYAGAATAQVANGDFHDGLAGWQAAGDAATSGAGGPHLVLTTASATLPDDFDAGLPAGARNMSGNDPLPVGLPQGLEDAVGVPLGAFDTAPADGVVAYEGSAATQTFTTAAGDRLSFQWDLGTLDRRHDSTLADVAFVVIDGRVITLANTLAATFAATDGQATHTGWHDYATTFADAGTHTISFAVVDIGDYDDTSTLSVGSVLVSSVPEASTLSLMGAGLALMGLQRRRRTIR